MSVPSVVGRPLSEARAILEAAGVRVTGVKETRPPGGAPSGMVR
ncbi:MAG: PASTA domain-containing protein, partial [Gemmatimonadales bacterium]|nr:PASTA domain-containing protein [Gemmatimonadales bacterium]